MALGKRRCMPWLALLMIPIEKPMGPGSIEVEESTRSFARRRWYTSSIQHSLQSNSRYQQETKDAGHANNCSLLARTHIHIAGTHSRLVFLVWLHFSTASATELRQQQPGSVQIGGIHLHFNIASARDLRPHHLVPPGLFTLVSTPIPPPHCFSKNLKPQLSDRPRLVDFTPGSVEVSDSRMEEIAVTRVRRNDWALANGGPANVCIALRPANRCLRHMSSQDAFA